MPRGQEEQPEPLVDKYFRLNWLIAENQNTAKEQQEAVEELQLLIACASEEDLIILASVMGKSAEAVKFQVDILMQEKAKAIKKINGHAVEQGLPIVIFHLVISYSYSEIRFVTLKIVKQYSKSN